MRIQLNKKIEQKLRYLMNNIKTINKDNEIAAFILGTWDKDGAICEDIIIPKQTVSRNEAEIESGGLIDMINKYGIEITNRIIGHWHIHPFDHGKPSWSGTDETKISTFMQEGTKRDVFIFLLSGTKQLVNRVEIRTTIEKNGNEIFIEQSLPDVKIDYEMSQENIEELKEQIKENVTEDTKMVTYTNGTLNSQTRQFAGYDTDDYTGVNVNDFRGGYTAEPFMIWAHKNSVHVKVESGMLDEVEAYFDTLGEIIKVEESYSGNWTAYKITSKTLKTDELLSEIEAQLYEIWGELEFDNTIEQTPATTDI